MRRPKQSSSIAVWKKYEQYKKDQKAKKTLIARISKMR